MRARGWVRPIALGAVAALFANLTQATAQGDHIPRDLSRGVFAHHEPKQGLPHLDTPLNALLSQWANDPAGAATRAITKGLKVDGDRVHVTLLMLDEEAADLAAAQIPKLGGEVTAHYRQILDAWVPIPRLEDLGALPKVSLVHQPFPSMDLQLEATSLASGDPPSGSVVTQGLMASNANAWQGEGFLGGAVNVAVIDSFEDVAAAQSAGELPTVACHPDCASLDVSSRHGTACAEIIHDMAPSAQLTLSSASTAAEFAQTVVELAASSQDVISVSKLFPDVVPGDGTGPMADAIQTAHSTHGANVVIAAGNHAEYHWDGAFADSDGDDFHEFPGGDELNLIVVPALATVAVYLRWNAWPVTDQDFDLKLYYWDGAGWLYVDGSLVPQTGSQPPFEFLSTSAPFTGIYGLVVEKYSAETNPVLDMMVLSRQELSIQRTARSLTEPATSPDSLSVAAIDVGTFSLESYSSRGPTHGPGGSLAGPSHATDHFSF